MADDKSPPKKGDDKKPAKKGGPPQKSAPAPGADDPMATGAGVQPPMPGSGMDPYAALAGQISNISPVGQPNGGFGGQGGMGDAMGGIPPGGGFDGGMGMGAGGGQMLQGGPPGQDPIQAALMSQASPMAFPPDIGQTWADPVQDMAGNLSVEQLLTLLTMMQGGIPSSGAGPMQRPGSVASGLIPSGIAGGAM